MAETAKPKKRMVKKAETVREKTQKMAAAKPAKKSGIVRLTLGYIAAPFKWIGRKLAKLGRFKVVRILGKILWPTYFRESWKELRQVTWPTGRETRHLTVAVLVFSVAITVVIGIVDFGLDKLFKKLIIG